MGMAVMTGAVAFAAIVLLKCFGLAYQQPDYTVAQYISAIFTRDSMLYYLFAGVVFSLGLWIAINSAITALKSFFDL